MTGMHDASLALAVARLAAAFAGEIAMPETNTPARAWRAAQRGAG